MTARAIWKGEIRLPGIGVPVKLYSAIEDRSVHFRLLHEKDQQPVSQAMVNPETDEIVPRQETQRAYFTDEGQAIVISREELDRLKPESSREIEVLKFLPPAAIDHRWYDRPYYLGPDGGEAPYLALAFALVAKKREGLVRWVMRNKEYFGALRLFEGYPMLISLRYAEQVLSAEELEPPGGKPLDKRELKMAGDLIGMLEADFEPEAYRDEYRERVMALIEKKRQGGRLKRPVVRKKRAPEDLTEALEASLKRAGHG